MKNKIKIEFNRDSKGQYWRVIKKSCITWKIMKRIKIHRKEWLKHNKDDKH